MSSKQAKIKISEKFPKYAFKIPVLVSVLRMRVILIDSCVRNFPHAPRRKRHLSFMELSEDKIFVLMRPYQFFLFRSSSIYFPLLFSIFFQFLILFLSIYIFLITKCFVIRSEIDWNSRIESSTPSFCSPIHSWLEESKWWVILFSVIVIDKLCSIKNNILYHHFAVLLHTLVALNMEKFAVDLDKVLNDFEYNEGTFCQ